MTPDMYIHGEPVGIVQHCIYKWSKLILYVCTCGCMYVGMGKRTNTGDKKLTEGVRRQMVDHLTRSLQSR